MNNKSILHGRKGRITQIMHRAGNPAGAVYSIEVRTLRTEGLVTGVVVHVTADKFEADHA